MAPEDTPSIQPRRHEPHFHERVAGRSIEWLIRWSSSVSDRTFFDTEDFPWVCEIECEWQLMRKELDKLMEERVNIPNFQDVNPPRNYGLTQDDSWKAFFLYIHGYRADENCERCPETARLVKKIPGLLEAFFSILAPRKHIPPHRGRYNGVLRYHLGLIVPQPAHACWIRVGDDVHHWEEGKSMIFDDTNQHEVRNDTDGWRVVLFVDFPRPLPFPVSVFNKGMIYAISRRQSVRDIQDYLKSHPGGFSVG